MGELDAGQYPSAAAYLRALPGGLDAYPEAQCVTDVVLTLFEDFPALRDMDSASPRITELLRKPYKSGNWMLEAEANTILLMARDTHFRGDAAYLAWSEEMVRKVYDRPLYRVLMRILSPTLMVMGAQKRWSAFRRGTQFSVEKRGDRAYTLLLGFPQDLFNQLHLDAFGISFRVALEFAGAKDVQVPLTDSSRESGTFGLSWST